MNAVAAIGQKARTVTHVLLDAIVNSLSGAGSASDAGGAGMAMGVECSYQEATTLYRYYWIARKIISIPVSDMMKNGRTITNLTPEELKRYEERWRNLQCNSRMTTALRWARLYGGGVIVPVRENMDMAAPRNIAELANGGINRLLVFDASRFTASIGTRVVSDMTSTNYGMPEVFQHRGLPVHPSHLIVAHGEEQPNPEQGHSNMGVHPWFGSSRMHYCKEPVIRAHAAYENMSSLLQANNLDVLKVPGLYDLVTQCTTEEEQAEMNSMILQRVGIMARYKGMHNVAVIDAKEELDRMKYDLTAMPSVLRESVVEVSGASHIPVTRFAGISPGGMNATGDADLEHYYDDITGEQFERARPLYDSLDEVITADVFGQSRVLEYTINSPNAETDAEKLAKKKEAAELASALTDIAGVPESNIIEFVRETVLPTIPQEAVDRVREEEGLADEGGRDDPDE